MRHFQMAEVTTSAAVLAYYTLLSIFPAVLVIGNLLPMLGLNAKTVLAYLQTAVPPSIYSFLRPFIYDFLSRGSGGVLTTGALVAVWSTSQGIAAFQRSVNRAYGVARYQNPIINRVVSFVWLLVLILFMFVLTFTYGIGEQVMQGLQGILHFNPEYIHFFNQVRWPITFGGLFIILTILYYFVPNARVRLRFVAVGALLVTLAWMGVSRIFSLYSAFFSHNITSYKTIGAFILLMIWLDLSGILVMVGATINATLQDIVEGKIEERLYFWQKRKEK
ncbi:YihY/virulence factor BrkB family protein [Lactobacillus sp. 3B(2020)]|uniref:YihY/virulence factor BrkB family protein n=1 Tax=Lactobacillus sp. 3B(2020) TaxID=2695882 RepID=UPI0015DE66F2|nr:YihY/virulence factor BrkB family protein [Lactobacillus sp. 3B(2020)]QLL70969.1 YihY family inner membrane protein [Lactobacillus sp. 3B(2020)]